jgi:hypothetical protein
MASPRRVAAFSEGLVSGKGHEPEPSAVTEVSLKRLTFQIAVAALAAAAVEARSEQAAEESSGEAAEAASRQPRGQPQEDQLLARLRRPGRSRAARKHAPAAARLRPAPAAARMGVPFRPGAAQGLHPDLVAVSGRPTYSATSQALEGSRDGSQVQSLRRSSSGGHPGPEEAKEEDGGHVAAGRIPASACQVSSAAAGAPAAGAGTPASPEQSMDSVALLEWRPRYVAARKRALQLA